MTSMMGELRPRLNQNGNDCNQGEIPIPDSFWFWVLLQWSMLMEGGSPVMLYFLCRSRESWNVHTCPLEYASLLSTKVRV